MPVICYGYEFWRGDDVLPVAQREHGPLMLLIERCGGPVIRMGSGVTVWLEDDVALAAATALQLWLSGAAFPPRPNPDGSELPPPLPPDPDRTSEANALALLPPVETVERFVEWASDGGFGCRALVVTS